MRILLGSLLVMALTTPAAASYPSCASVTDAPPNPTGVYAFTDPLDPFAGTQLWMETNLEPGLQRTACQRADGTIAFADTRLLDIAA